MPTIGSPQHDVMASVDDLLVEKLWHDLDGQVSHQEIVQTVNQIAAQFQDATVTTFVPIFIRRLALDQLKRKLDEKN
jgi:hypothetical protein